MPTQEQVLEALKKVKFPGLSRDIVSFGFVRDIAIEGSVVSFTINFQTENPAVGEQIARDAYEAVRALEGVSDANVSLEIGRRHDFIPVLEQQRKAEAKIRVGAVQDDALLMRLMPVLAAAFDRRQAAA